MKAEPVSASNMLPPGIRRQLTHHIPAKTSEESCNFAIDEVWRRDQLAYDLDLVVVSGEDEPKLISMLKKIERKSFVPKSKKTSQKMFCGLKTHVAG